MSNWFEREKEAILGDRQAILECVGALRLYRQASKQLLNARYGDGSCDGCAMFNFSEEITSIENLDQE